MFLPVHDHQGVRGVELRLPGGYEGLQERPAACQHIIDDQHAGSVVDRAFDSFSQSMILGLFSHDKGTVGFPGLSGKGIIGYSCGQGDGSDFQASHRLDGEVAYGRTRELRHEPPGIGMRKQGPAVHVIGTRFPGGEDKAFVGIPLKGMVSPEQRCQLS